MQSGKPLNKHDAAAFNWNQSWTWSNVPWAIKHLDDEDERVWRDAQAIVCALGLTTHEEIDEYGAWSDYIINNLWRRYEEAQATDCANDTDVKGIIKSVFENPTLTPLHSDGKPYWLMVRKERPIIKDGTLIFKRNKVALTLDNLVEFGNFWLVDSHDLLEELISDVYNNPTKWFTPFKYSNGEIVYHNLSFQERVGDFIRDYVEPLNYCDLLDIKPYYIQSREAWFDSEEVFAILKAAKQYCNIANVYKWEFDLIKDALEFLKERSDIQFKCDEERAYYACLFATLNVWPIRNLYYFNECDLLTAGERSVEEHCLFTTAINEAFKQWCSKQDVDYDRLLTLGKM